MDKRIIAHRGAAAYAPENTLEAFGLASDMGAGGIELDVYLTADNRLAVHHDAQISRMTNGASAGFIEQMTLDELKSYRFCGRFAEQYPHAKLPTLGEVYAYLKPTGMRINTEIKSGRDDEEHCRRLIALLLEEAEKYGMKERVLYSTYSVGLLTMLHEIDASVGTALLVGGTAAAEKPWETAKAAGCSAVHPQYKTVLRTDGFCDFCHALGMKVHPWTVDTRDDVNELLAAGADAVITNYPDILAKSVE